MTGTDGSASDNASLQVNAGGLASIVISPSTSSISAGGSRTYTATGFDSHGNSLGDVTGDTTFSIAPDGSCSGASCGSNTAGPHTVTGTDGSASDNASLQVNAGGLASIVISPSTSSISAGGSRTYTATGFDSHGNSLGDVTGDTTFSISPDGSCSGASCGSNTAGPHTVTGTDGSASDNASLQVNAVVSPAHLTLTKTASPDPDVQEQNPITYTLVVGNDGTGNANNVVVTDNLPASTTFDSVSTTLGSCSHTTTTVTCTIDPLTAGGSATVTIIVQAPNVTSDTPITNTAQATSSNATTVNASANTNVLANTGGSTEGDVPPGTTVPLTFTTSTQSNNGTPAVDGTDNSAVFIIVPPGGPGGSITLDELPCPTAPCTGAAAAKDRAAQAAATSKVVLGGVVFNVVPPAGYPTNKPFKVTLLYDKTLHPKKGAVFYFKQGVTPHEITLPHCGTTPPNGGKPCVLTNALITTGPALIKGDWKVVVRISSDPRMHR